MKEVKLTCPKCGSKIVYKNVISWILHTPFHHFGKRWTNCTACGAISLMGKDK